MSAIGGAMIPSFVMPAAVKSVCRRHARALGDGGLPRHLLAQPVARGILPEVGVLLGMAALLVSISVLIFRRRLRTELG